MLKPWIPLAGIIVVLSLIESPVIGAPVPPKASTPVARPVVPAIPVVNPQVARQVYLAQCSFCHAPKAATVRPDLVAWIKLIYTSGCPEVTIKLDESQRKAIKAYMDTELKAVPPKLP